MHYINEYYSKIQNGQIIVGEFILKIYDIIVKNLNAKTWFFCESKANNAIKFIEGYCRHSKGRNDLIKLELWQKSLISLIFGVVNECNLRVFREVFVVIGRKNGKSLLASAIMACIAFLDEEYGAEIFCVATKKEQAEIVYECFQEIIFKDAELKTLVKRRKNDLYISESNVSIKKLAFSPSGSDGLNPQLVVCDEVAAWKGEKGIKQYEVFKSALGARKQPLLLSITTAGYENEGIYDELFKRSTEVLNGNSREMALLPLIYKIDDVDKWADIEELKKANPNMSVSVSENYFTEEIAVANMSSSKKAEFLTKYCDIKQNSVSAFLDYYVVENAGFNAELSQFKGQYCVCGLDLSMTTDLTSACVIIEQSGVLYVFNQFFMPAQRFQKAIAEDNISYDIFVKQGILTLSGEHKVDYHDVFQWFKNLQEVYELIILQIGYDNYSAQYLIDELSAYGYKTDDVYQGTNLTKILFEFKGLLEDGNLKICNNELLKHHFLNVALKEDLDVRKFRPVKLHKNSRIDGFVSVIDALTVRHKYWNKLQYALVND